MIKIHRINFPKNKKNTANSQQPATAKAAQPTTSNPGYPAASPSQWPGPEYGSRLQIETPRDELQRQDHKLSLSLLMTPRDITH